MRRVSSWFALALVVTACSTAPTGGPVQGSVPSAEGPKPAKKITAGIPADPAFVYNALNVGGTGGQGGQIERLAHRGLTTHDPFGDLHPVAAEQVPSLENGLWKLLPDGRMETTWKLRQNSVWQDGTPFTSDDLLFTATVIQDRTLPDLSRNANYGRIDKVTAPDARTIVVSWKEPFIDADSMFGDIALPIAKHLMEPSFADRHDAFLEQPYWSTEFIGLGPFKVRELERGSHILFDAFDRFALGRPKVDVVEVKFLVDENLLSAAILAGAVELTLGHALSAERGVQLRDEWKDGHLDLKMGDWYVMYPQFVNPNPAALLDVRFRRALLYGTDRQSMTETLEGGLSKIAESIVNLTAPDYREIEPSIVHYPFDPARAEQLLDEVGLAKGSDGIRRDSSGQRIEIEINATMRDAHQKLQATLQSQWPKVGVAVATLVIPPQRAQDAEFRAIFPGLAVQGHPHDIAMYQSSQARLPERNFRGNNVARYMNPELDALIDRYFATIPKQERTTALGQVVHHLTDQLVHLPLMWQVDPTMIGNRILNVTGEGAGGGTGDQAWNAQDWDVKSY